MKHLQATAAQELVHALDREIRSRGRGSIRSVDRAVGYSEGWWQHRAESGDVTVDQGIWLYYLDRPRESIEAQTAALDMLPEGPSRNRCTAFQVKGLAVGVGPSETSIAAGIRRSSVEVWLRPASRR